MTYVEAVPGSRAPPATLRRAPRCSSRSVGDECRPGTGSETASGCGGPGCPHTESPGSGSPRCSFWSTARRRQGGYVSPWCQSSIPLNSRGLLQRTMKFQASRHEEGANLAQVTCFPHRPWRGSHPSGSQTWGHPSQKIQAGTYRN